MTSTTTSTPTDAGTARPKTTGRQPSEQAIDAAIDSATRLLRLPSTRTGSGGGSARDWSGWRRDKSRRDGLWTFQVNRPAQLFYERPGFAAVERTDGSTNEEREPAVRYMWPGRTAA